MALSRFYVLRRLQLHADSLLLVPLLLLVASLFSCAARAVPTLEDGYTVGATTLGSSFHSRVLDGRNSSLMASWANVSCPRADHGVCLYPGGSLAISRKEADVLQSYTIVLDFKLPPPELLKVPRPSDIPLLHSLVSFSFARIRSDTSHQNIS